MTTEPRNDDRYLSPMDDPYWEPKPAKIPWRRDGSTVPWPENATAAARWKYRLTMFFGGAVVGIMLLMMIGGTIGLPLVYGFVAWMQPEATAPVEAAAHATIPPFGFAIDPQLGVSADGRTAYLFNDGRLFRIEGDVATEIRPATSPAR